MSVLSSMLGSSLDPAPRGSRPARRSLLLLSALLSALLVAGMLAAAAPASAVKPRNDHARMPRACVKPVDLIPPQPTVCPINGFDADRPTILLWGDSHAWMMIPALKRAVRDKSINLVAIVMGGCPPMDNRVRSTDAAPSCFRNNALALEQIDKIRKQGSAVRVVLGGSWGRYRQSIRAKDGSYTEQMGREMLRATPRLMKKLARRNVLTDVVGQVATVPAKRRACPKGEKPFACNVVRRKAIPDERGTKRWLRRTMRPLAGNRAPIDVNGFCTSTACKGKVGRWYTWWDDLHISATMSRKVHRVFKPTVNKVLKQAEKRDDRETNDDPPPSTSCPLPIPILCG